MKGFRINVIFRVVIIVALALALAYVLVDHDWFFTPLVLSMLLTASALNLIYYVEKTSRNLTQFLLNIKQGGFTNKFSQNSKNGLSKLFNDVIEEFEQVSMEKESHYLYLQTLNENIGIALISFDENGKIDLFNPAARDLFKKPNLQQIADIKQVDKKLEALLTTMAPGERSVLKVVVNGELLQLAVQCKRFVVKEKTFTLLMIQNIQAELEQKEVEAWQNLISVLTHEIMNSATPIASLSQAVNNQFAQANGFNEIDDEDQKDIRKSISTIENRSRGLMRFVNAYKNFSKSPDLNYSEFDINTVFKRIKNLFQPDLEYYGISMAVLAPDHLKCRADKTLIEQVILNLVKNAIEVLTGSHDGIITLEAGKVNMANLITISDNGPGIPKELMDKVFIPFFTTKKKGTGVGLSFARKVMKLHGGQILIHSEINNGTRITLQF